MDLTSPLSSLIPSLDAVVLEVLEGTHGSLGASKIHQLGHRGSRPGVVKVLDRLVEHGLVIAEPTNHGAAYRLNREHVLHDAVQRAAGARHEFIRRLSEACLSLYPAPVSVALFGSVARRESGPASDIDLLIVVDDTVGIHDPEWVDQLDELRSSVLAWTGNRLAPITMTRTHLRELVGIEESIVNSWRDEARTVAGTDITRLLRADGP